MNKDTLIGFVLIGIVLIGFSWWNQPSEEQIAEYQRQQDSIAAVQSPARKRFILFLAITPSFRCIKQHKMPIISMIV